MSRIVIGDPHGCLKTLKALIAKLPEDVAITIAGDLIDRGPDSAGVVEYCKQHNIDTTLGNHEKMMMDFFKEYQTLLDGKVLELREEDLFLINGGFKTIASYGFTMKQVGFSKYLITPPKDLSMIKAHLEWMASLPFFIEYPEIKDEKGRYLVVSHSSINSVFKHKNREDFLTDPRYEQTVIWGRPTEIRDNPEIYNIFGHTPQNKGAKIKVPFANVDTGCCFGDDASKREGYGVLSGLQYPELTLYVQENIEN